MCYVCCFFDRLHSYTRCKLPTKMGRKTLHFRLKNFFQIFDHCNAVVVLSFFSSCNAFTLILVAQGPKKNLLGDSDERMWIVAYIIDKTKSSPAYASSSGINGSGLSGEMEYETDIFLLGRPGSKPEDFGKCFYYSITVSFILWGDYQPQTKFFL